MRRLDGSYFHENGGRAPQACKKPPRKEVGRVDTSLCGRSGEKNQDGPCRTQEHTWDFLLNKPTQGKQRTKVIWVWESAEEINEDSAGS